MALFSSMREKSGDDDELRIDFVYWSGFLWCSENITTRQGKRTVEFCLGIQVGSEEEH